jgi:hypothetical protein
MCYAWVAFARLKGLRNMPLYNGIPAIATIMGVRELGRVDRRSVARIVNVSRLQCAAKGADAM